MTLTGRGRASVRDAGDVDADAGMWMGLVGIVVVVVVATSSRSTSQPVAILAQGCVLFPSLIPPEQRCCLLVALKGRTNVGAPLRRASALGLAVRPV